MRMSLVCLPTVIIIFFLVFCSHTPYQQQQVITFKLHRPPPLDYFHYEHERLCAQINLLRGFSKLLCYRVLFYITVLIVYIFARDAIRKIQPVLLTGSIIATEGGLSQLQLQSKWKAGNQTRDHGLTPGEPKQSQYL